METPANQGGIVVEKNQPVSHKPQKKMLILIGVLLILIPLLILLIQILGKKQQPAPQAAISPTPTQEAILAHKAKQDMPIFLKTILQPAYIPSPQDASNIKGAKEINRFSLLNKYSANEVLSATLLYKNSKNMIERRIDFITPSSNDLLTTTSAPTITTKYFKIKPQGTWKCSAISLNNATSTICENFWTVKNLVKMGIGVINPIPGQKQGTNVNSTVYFCEIYKGTSFFDKKSCSGFKAETGI